MMNELDNLRNAWKAISDRGSLKDYSAEEIKRIVKGRSNNELAKIRRKIITEWSVALLLSLAMVLYVRFINPGDTKFALAFIIIILAFSFIPYYKVIRLKFSNHTDLKTYLTEFINRFEKLVRQYIRMSVFLMPLAGLGGFMLGFHSAATQTEWHGLMKWINVLLILGFLVMISWGGYWLQQRYFSWIYGKNIQRLRECLADLEEAEEME
ncbi:MAG: hypothetical protein A2437_16330 [Bacteroidetes bacterium RIFOXYC2_FULL_40_12]|jgi:hypothetical protein|nr:MAG: hypothetical protein A2437_16330 [Bacteroidetes bacterium RIFOXYC2_FULL_40_12]